MSLSGVQKPIDFTRAGRSAGEPAHGVAANPWIAGLARFGHVVRGIIYFVPGLLALQLALGQHGQATTQAGAIDIIAHQPFGQVLLIAVAIGLAGYACWGVVRAVFDPLHRGHSPAGLAKRIGYTASAIAYLGLLAGTIRYLTGALSQVAPSRDWTVDLLGSPLGALFVGVVGVCWIFGSGIAQIVQGWRAHFERDLALDRVSAGERRFAMRLGRVGLVSRGIVFTIIGLLLVSAALHRHATGELGLDGALLQLARHSYGRLLVGATGLGLMAFGAYSAMCARWMRMSGARPAPASSLSPTSTP